MVKVDDLIGVRFKTHGRVKEDGFDCYGLAIEVSKRFGHELNDLWYKKSDSQTFSENAENMVSKMSSKVEETNEQKEGNLILFADEKGNMVHIGVILEEGKFIHAEIGGVRVTELDEYYRKNWKVYKWL
jgi:cell wall-associated NlpC family hydrolase